MSPSGTAEPIADAAWTPSNLGDQRGRVAVVTGANTGVGLATAARLAAQGATVILACRDRDRGERAAGRLAAWTADRRPPQVVVADLASMASVRAGAEQILASCARLDLLINNAGVMAIPFERTEDGVERTFATNHLGHFALTGLLLDRLLATPSSRVITVSSNAHRRAAPQFDRLAHPEDHDPGAAYDRSKLANLLFTFELQRRLEAEGAATISVAAHPGNARTALWRTSSWLERRLAGSRTRLVSWLVQSPEEGALPTLRAATDPALRGGAYLGPSGRFGFTGDPVPVAASPAALDLTAQRHLFELSEELSGVTYRLRA